MVTILLLSAFLGPLDDPKLCWTVATDGIGTPTVDAVPIPRRTIVKKGQVIRISGRIQSATTPPLDISGSVYVRVGIDTRQQLNVTGPWTYEWNTERESGSTAKLTIRYRTGADAEAILIRTCDVTFASTEPIKASATPSPDGSARYSFQLSPGLSMDKPKLLVDGNEVNAPFDSTGSATLSRADLAGPGDQVIVQVTGAISQNGNNVGVISSIPVKLDAVHDLTVDASGVTMTNATDPFETMLDIPFKASGALKPESVQAIVAGKAVRGIAKESSFQLDPRDVDPAMDREIWLVAVDSAGRRVYSKKTSLDALKLRELRGRIETQLVKERERLRRVFTFDFGKSWSISSKGVVSADSGSNRSHIANGYGSGLPGGDSDGANGAGGVTLLRRHVVHYYAPGTPDGQAEIGSQFPTFWKNPLSGAGIRKSVNDRKGTAAWAQQYSFLSPRHKRLADQIIESLLLWADMVDSAEAARSKALVSQTYRDVSEFTVRLNECELLRLKANRNIAEMELDLGVTPHWIALTRWVVSPSSQEETSAVKQRAYAAFPWWAEDPPASMYP